MSYLALFFLAWIACRVAVFPADADLISFGAAGIQGALFALATWKLARRSETPNWVGAAGWMLLAIGILGFGGAYGRAQDQLLSVEESRLQAFLDWPGLLMTLAVALIIAGKWRKRGER